MSELTTPIPNAGPHVTMEPGVDVDIEIVGTQTRQRGHFVGMEPGQYLILAVPEAKTPGGIRAATRGISAVRGRRGHDAKRE